MLAGVGAAADVAGAAAFCGCCGGGAGLKNKSCLSFVTQQNQTKFTSVPVVLRLELVVLPAVLAVRTDRAVDENILGQALVRMVD